MFSNFSNFLSGSLRILGIANRAIPLVKEISPTIKTIRTKLSTTSLPKLNLIQPPKINTSSNTNNSITTQAQKIGNQTNGNNSLTFFQ